MRKIFLLVGVLVLLAGLLLTFGVGDRGKVAAEPDPGVTITVQDINGVGVSGAAVQIWNAIGANLLLTKTTDASGQATWDPWTLGDLTFQARAYKSPPTYTTWAAGFTIASTSFTVASGTGAATLNLTLVTGQVRDKNNNPVSGANVEFRWAGTNTAATWVTDSTGNFSAWLRNGYHTFSAYKMPPQPINVFFTIAGTGFTVGAGQPTTVTVNLNKFLLKVKNVQGNPLSGVIVQLGYSGNGSSITNTGADMRQTTDANGVTEWWLRNACTTSGYGFYIYLGGVYMGGSPVYCVPTTLSATAKLGATFTTP